MFNKYSQTKVNGRLVQKKNRGCFILPPHMMKAIILNTDNEELRSSMFRTLAISHQAGGRRSVLGSLKSRRGSSQLSRTAYDCTHEEDKSFAKPVRREGDPKSSDAAVNEAYDFSGDTYDFYNDIFKRNSIDNAGLPLNSYAHYGW